MFRSISEEHEQIDPAEALMREVGVQLRSVRLERGEDLDQVAENLRIKPAYLEGIERGDLSIMPGRTYALGFLRSYAEYLGFDGDDLIKQIKSTVENLTDRARLHIRAPLPENRLPKTSLVVLSLALVGGVYAGWSYLNDHRQLDVETVAEVPDDLRRPTLDSLPAATSAQEPEERLAAPATAGDRATPTEPVGPVDRPVEGADPRGPQVVDPATRIGVRDEVRSADQGSLPQAMRQPPAAEAAAEVAAPEPFQTNAPTAASGPAETPVDGAEPSRMSAARALDSIIEGESARSAEAAGDGRSQADAPVDRSNRPAEGERGSASTDERSIRPDAGPASQAGSTVGDVGQSGSTAGGLRSRRAQVGSLVDADARPGDGPSEAQGPPAGEAAGIDADRPVPPGTAEEVLAALGGGVADPTASGLRGTLQVYGRENTDARVVIRARERSWIQITSESGDYLQSLTLEEGDVFLVPDRTDLTLWTGNAGGLEVIVDGRTLPPLGPDGSVERDIPLDPDRLFAEGDGQR